jgi:hypothetical protein
MSRATMRDRAASLDGAGGSRSMVTVMILHDVDDVDHWLSSPRRMEFFGALGMTAPTFVVDREKSNRVGLIPEVPSMAAFQEAMGSAAAADAMKFDGVRPETIVTLNEASVRRRSARPMTPPTIVLSRR